MTQRYRVILIGRADVTATIEVEAASEDEAERKALRCDKSGDVVWQYHGVQGDSIEVSEIAGVP